jgi:hypothetical protein
MLFAIGKAGATTTSFRPRATSIYAMRDVDPATLRTPRRRLVYLVLSFAAVDLLWLLFIARGVYRLLSP